jgi:N,N-dimethylformamidase beta subunit-like, C-terminal
MILLRMRGATRAKCASGPGRALGGGALAALALAVGAAAGPSAAPPVTDEPGSIPAAFLRRSYAPGERAVLGVWRPAGRLTIRFYRVGPGARARRNDVMTGVAVGPAVHRPGASRLVLTIPSGPSSLYFAELTAAGGGRGYAPFVLRARRPGTSRVAVVLPTNTWQAYNFRDANGDGIGDTWYAEPGFNGVDLTRPFLDRGVPPYFRQYDLGFLRWLSRSGRRADFLSDDDLEGLSGRRLKQLYDLVVFPGHEEYVSERVWDAVERYRDLGGNLAFLSANDFFYRVERRGDRIFRTGRFRDLGRSDAALLGETYVGWFKGVYRNRPYVVTGARRARWLFRGTGLHDGSSFGTYGIEVDQASAASPPHTVVLARITDVFGPGRSAEMTYYATKAGAKVFSAGVINFGGSSERPVVSRLLENLWRRLSRP